MVRNIIILLLVLAPNTAYTKCDYFHESKPSSMFFSFSSHEIKPEKSTAHFKDKIEIKFVDALNYYIEIFNTKYRSQAFHDKFQKELKEIVPLKYQQEVLDRYSKYKRFDKSIKDKFIEVAKEKHVETLYCLGYIYEYGVGVDISYIEAWAWYNTAFAVEGIFAKKHRERVWKHLTWQTELEAQKLSDQYTYLYTNITSTPSTTILR